VYLDEKKTVNQNKEVTKLLKSVILAQIQAEK